MRGRARKNQGAGASAKRRKRRGAATQVTGDEEPEPEQQPPPWDTPMSKLEVLRYFKGEITSSVSGQTEGFNENTIRHTHSLPPFPLSLSLSCLSFHHHHITALISSRESLKVLLACLEFLWTAPQDKLTPYQVVSSHAKIKEFVGSLKDWRRQVN